MIESFEIPSFTSAQLSDLHYRLDNGVYPNELTTQVGNGWEYGTPRKALEPVVQEWRHSFDWEKPRAEMNQWKHYKLTTAQGLKLHFIHEPSNNPNAIPLMLLHGWPSTFYEFHKVINLLRDGQNGQAFHVVVPSLPGYGFSDPPTAPGFGIAKMGEILNELMLALGYSKYMTHGTDWGSTISHQMVTRYENHCSAAHFTMFLCAPPLPTLTNLWNHPMKVAKFLLGATVLGFDRVYGPGQFTMKGTNFADVMNDSEAGYRAIQGTRPYTLAYGLADSPIGLLGWILEKYHTYTWHQDKAQSSTLPSTLPANEVLTQASIYWLTNSMSSSMRIYYETLNQIKHEGLKMFGHVNNPIGISAFQGEVLRVPSEWMEVAGDLKFLNEHPLGGHFSAMEEPELLVADIQTFGKKVSYVFQ
ncbi:unnamed protein product [Absidia cylindrospora]